MDSGNFINFHCHSEYTFLGSLLKVEDLVGFCAYNGFRGCAVTDTLSTYSFFKLNKLCERENIKPVYGLELFIHGVSGKGHYPVLLIAQNNTGLQNLFTLNSIAHTANLKNHFFVLPFEIVLKYSEGLALISESEFLFHKDNFAYLKRVIERFNECFPNRFFLEVNYTGNSKSSELKEIVNIAQHFELTPIGCTETRYLRNDHEAFHFLNSYRMKSHKKDERGFPIDADGDYHLKRPDEMEACFKNHPDFLENAARLFESIDTHFDIKSFKIPSISKNTSRLRNVVMRKAQRLKLGEEYFQRLEYELEVIENMELSNFFLIIGDIAGFMKHKRIPFGWGRGSSVSSLVLYLLGITRVDPVEHNLIFERFLNPGRKQLPDVDIDVCWKRRGEVFDFICAKYGTNNVSHIAAIDRLLARSAIRETAKAFRLPGSKLQAILARMPYAFTGEMYIQTAIDSEPELKRMFDEDTEVRRFFEIALRIEGVASHTTVHAGGVVILPQGINRYASVEFSRSGDKVCQITKDDIEDTGFIKIDLLGLRAITIIDEAMRLAKIGCIDFQNQAAFDLLSRADAIGVFQLESSGMRDLLKKLKPQSILTLCHVIALYRPGPRKSGMMDEYIRRHAENVPYHIHPAIEPYTRDTKGLFIYQEQVLQIAHFTAGMSWTKADKLRKALSKKHRAPILEMKDEFVRGCIANGLEIDYALQLFGVLVDFGRYGFNLSHSMAYAYNAYAGAFLKANYPIQFFVCSLNNNLDFLSRLNRIISDIKFHGIGILPLDINKSRVMFSIENGTIRSGLTVVKYVGLRLAKKIYDERKESGPFVDFLNFYLRMKGKGINIKSAEYLIKSGVFDSTGNSRATLLASLREIAKFSTRQKRETDENNPGLFEDEKSMDTESFETTSLKNFLDSQDAARKDSVMDRFEMEMEATDLFLTHHPLDSVAEELDRYNVDLIADIETLAEATIIGYLYRIRTIKTKSGGTMAFVMFTDYSGTQEGIVFPKVYRQYAHILRKNEVYLTKGKVEDGKIIIDELILFKELIRA